MSLSRRVLAALLAAAWLAAGAVSPALAEKPDPSLERKTGPWSTHTRYPDDRAYAFGNTQTGPAGEEQPYVERCSWNVDGLFFGMPHGIKQTCVRYTPDSVQ